MKIHVKNTPELVIPKAGSPASSGYDVVAISEPEIVGVKGKFRDGWNSIDYIEYRTGLFIAPQSKLGSIHDGHQIKYHTLIFPRSSVSKYNLVLANCIGLIDNDYRGEVILRFKYVWQPEDLKCVVDTLLIVGEINPNKIYKKGDKIGQLVSGESIPIEWEVVANLSETIRSGGGFGSTNVPKQQSEMKPKLPILDDDEDIIRIRSAQPVIVEPTEMPKRKYDVDKPFSQIGKSTILEKWKEKAPAEKPLGYEKLVKERETPAQ
jgi:dUTP pyrophosphatase